MSRAGWILLAAFYAVLLVFFARLVAPSAPPGAPDALFGIPTGDFATLWSAGRLAGAGRLATLYAPDLFQAWKTAAFGHQVTPNPWIYPPGILPLAMLAAKIPLPAAFLLWDCSSLAAICLILRRCGLPWAAVGLCAASPAELLNLIYGQYGGMTGCLVFAALLMGRARPVLAGVLLGLVTIKPQAGLAAPFAWLAARNGRALAAAAAVFAGLALLPVVWLGPDCWLWFFSRLGPVAARIADAPFGQGYQLTGISVFWMLRSLGCGLAVAGAAQGVLAAAAIGLVVRLWRGAGVDPSLDRPALVALTLLLTLLVTPYGYSVDLVGYSVALVVLARAPGGGGSFSHGVLWLWPGYAPLVTALTGVLLTPLFILAACGLAWRRLRAA
jgi:hypothetical protein